MLLMQCPRQTVKPVEANRRQSKKKQGFKVELEVEATLARTV